MHGTEISLPETFLKVVNFPKCESFNRNFRDKNQMEQIIQVRNFQKFVNVVRQLVLFSGNRGMYHSPLEMQTGVISQMTDEIDLYDGIWRFYAREVVVLSHICDVMLLYTKLFGIKSN